MDNMEISKRLVKARMTILKKYPFFGRLLLNLTFGIADCGTAFTDMRRIVFDKEFAKRLSDEEICFVLLHEVLHCSLKHCIRGSGRQQFIYNIACDIVVNSTILGMMGKDEMVIDGEKAMHLAPDKSEGRTKNAEQVYSMLMKMSLQQISEMFGDKNTDNHSVWKKLSPLTLETIWNNHLREAAKVCGTGSSGIPDAVERELLAADYMAQTDWKRILHDFIRCDRKDYDFSRPDRRYSEDYVLPSFWNTDEKGSVENMWVLIDTSGSVSDEEIGAAYREIVSASEQIGTLCGYVSFFDCAVSEPVPFEDVNEFSEIKPIGGGGTLFSSIFEKLHEMHQMQSLPDFMIIITDGYSVFTDEKTTLGVPVIWLIVDSDIEPPWGVSAHINTRLGE